MDEKRTLPMDLRIYVADVTEHYNRKPAGMGKIFDAYLFDANLDVHICSFQANKECWYIGSTYIPTREMTDEEREEADEYLREANSDTPIVDYFDGNIKGHPYEVVPAPEPVEDEFDENKAEREVMEERIEHLQGNCWWEDLAGKPIPAEKGA
jgi:hypothetical protein